MKKDFTSDVSKLFWKLFEVTGNLKYIMLYSAIEHPELNLESNPEEEIKEL